ncbi:SufD family Fe-S cluster assembly protein [Marinicella meishanensis]|uniref:SufD family Fe-S cluster assembly protein n=1 Tax=Marinicella meishanensis TaxID=2873263 RepID=UPI001CBD938D|nr:SufD family Fe-S cluster assembly protein [Marinicella sp. NBU2979]
MAGSMSEAMTWLGPAESGQSLPAGAPQWLRDKQQAAIQQLSSMSVPHRKMEIWRYADVNRLQAQMTAENAPELPTPNAVDHTVIVVSQQGIQWHSDQPDWLTVEPISQMAAADWQDVQPQAHPSEQGMVVLNQAGLHGGVFLVVAAEQTNPAHVVELIYVHEGEHWLNLRNQFKLASNCQVTIKETHVGDRINLVSHWAVGPGAQVKREVTSRLQPEAMLVQFDHMELADGADVRAMHQRSNGALQHHQRQVQFAGVGAKYVSGSINKSILNNNICDIVNVIHNQKNNRSEVTHRSIAKDQSQIFNNARALVAVGADQSEIEQDLKNILLSADAKIFSKPELEVYADEVVAAHGSTIGALDEQSLFYLQSRGIELTQAREIMIESFEQEAQVC